MKESCIRVSQTSTINKQTHIQTIYCFLYSLSDFLSTNFLHIYDHKLDLNTVSLSYFLQCRLKFQRVSTNQEKVESLGCEFKSHGLANSISGSSDYSPGTIFFEVLWWPQEHHPHPLEKFDKHLAHTNEAYGACCHKKPVQPLHFLSPKLQQISS
ncbi:hypothetical protein V8G54_022374 [Vigna mungo]|uniref:Uncharacterized protein n=1 Tax=Vigna mungo TaxID=3915 RepID=A0AAQ3NHW0_VIGMU